MNITKFFKLAAAMSVCVYAMTVSSCDNDDDPKGPELKCNPDKVEVVTGKTATVTGVKEGTATITVTDAKQLKGKIKVAVEKITDPDKTRKPAHSPLQ